MSSACPKQLSACSGRLAGTRVAWSHSNGAPFPLSESGDTEKKEGIAAVLS